MKSFEAETYPLRSRCQRNLLDLQQLIIVVEGVVNGRSNPLLLWSVLHAASAVCYVEFLPSTMASVANQSEPLRVLVESTRSGLWVLCCRLCISILNRKLKKTGIFLDKVIWKSSMSHIALILKESCLFFPSFQIRMSGQGSIEYEVIISQNFSAVKHCMCSNPG